MTQKEKINELKNTIEFLYCKEGRSKSYISRLLELDRKTLSITMNEWGLVKANVSYLTPSNKKFANKHKLYIKSKLDSNISIKSIAKSLNVTEDYLRNIINKTEVLLKAKEDYKIRLKINAENNKVYSYHFENLDNEIWKPIMGYDSYYISNLGRVKKYVKSYDDYKLLTPYPNVNNGRLYVGILGKNLQVSRLVGFNFVDGYSEKNNTIDHIDNDVTNNKAENLQWTSQKNNNQFSYNRGRNVNKAYQKNGRFKKIILNNTYEFKTIDALAKFLNKSWTQTNRYITGEASFDGEIKLIY